MTTDELREQVNEAISTLEQAWEKLLDDAVDKRAEAEEKLEELKERENCPPEWGNCRRGCPPAYLDSERFCSPGCKAGGTRGEFYSIKEVA
jgi:hypothetical protein